MFSTFLSSNSTILLEFRYDNLRRRPLWNYRLSTMGEYEVDHILDSRLCRRQLQYLFLWKYYPISHATWEPITHLHNAPEVIRDFSSTGLIEADRGSWEVALEGG